MTGRETTSQLMVQHDGKANDGKDSELEKVFREAKNKPKPSQAPKPAPTPRPRRAGHVPPVWVGRKPAQNPLV